MQNSFDEKILEEAHSWMEEGQSVVLATVIQTWGSSPRPIGSRMIVSEQGNFSGSVSGGCVESAVAQECMSLLKDKKCTSCYNDLLKRTYEYDSQNYPLKMEESHVGAPAVLYEYQYQ